MSAEYRFLRFEIVGITTIAFLLVGILPMLEMDFISQLLTDMNGSLAIITGLFLLALPLGYGQHQLVVNKYRSSEKKRAVFEVLEDLVLDAEESYGKSGKQKNQPFFKVLNNVNKNSFLTALLDLCVYSTNSSINSDVFGRLGDRWSHFYARKAVGKYAPISSFVSWFMFLILGHFVSLPFNVHVLTLVIALFWWVIVFRIIGPVIDSYSKKIWFEISYLETSIVLVNKEEISKKVSEIVGSMIAHPEYVEKGKSY